MCYYNAIANFFAGVAAEEDSKWGESVAYLTRAEKSLNHSIGNFNKLMIFNYSSKYNGFLLSDF